MHQTFNDFIKDRTKGIMSKSPYASMYSVEKGWSRAADAYKTPFSAVHFDRAKQGEDVPEFDENTPYHFKCARGAEMVSEVWYDEKSMILKVAWVKSRTGSRGATPGNLTYYDHCSKAVFEKLYAIYLATGHCGHLLWEIIRVKGDEQGRYPYTDA